MKKFFSYPVYLIIVLSIICSILFGSLLKYHYAGGKRFQSLQRIGVFFAEIPFVILNLVQSKSFNPNKPSILKKHINKQRFKQFIPNKRSGLLVLTKYDHNLSRSVVDMIDLENFETVHTYKHDIAKMNKQIKNIREYQRINIDQSPIRFRYFHPLILEDGSMISHSGSASIFKVDMCSNLKWFNDKEKFHHSIMLDHEGNLWTGGHLNPYSKYIKKNRIINNRGKFLDDSVIKLNSDGKIIFNKSVVEILIENKILDINVIDISNKFDDPIHLNDIEPAFTNTKYWKKGDVFLSIRNQSSIVHYRPSTNQLINYIKGPFSQQHDVDIISPKEISIFNNNNFLIDNEYSEVIIYNFETNKFKKLFNNQLKKENFKTLTEGVSHILNDGSLLVEESNHGRIILFNKDGQKEWEYVNKDIDGNIGVISWVRIIEDEIFINKFKKLIENKKCIN